MIYRISFCDLFCKQDCKCKLSYSIVFSSFSNYNISLKKMPEVSDGDEEDLRVPSNRTNMQLFRQYNIFQNNTLRASKTFPI